MKKIVGVVTDALLPLQSRLQELKPLHGKLEELLHEKDITLKAKHDADVKRWVQELQAQSNDKMEQLLVQETSRIRAQIEAKDATTKEARKAAERLKEKKDATAERLKEEDATRDKFESMRLKMDHTLDKALGNFDVMRAMHDLTNQVKATQLQGSQRSEDWSRN
jgi:Tfp pilus assembly protein PilP